MIKRRGFKKSLDFEYNINHKVYGYSDSDEAHELIYEGQITKLFEPHYPKTIGIFELYIYDIQKSKDFELIDKTLEIIKDYSSEISGKFTNIYKFVEDQNINFLEKDRVIILTSCILLPDYRGRDVISELIKSIYLTHFTNNSLFIVNANPIQNIHSELDTHLYEYPIEISDGNGNYKLEISGNYFKLDSLPEMDEAYEYKLFAKMLKLGFKKFGDTSYFYHDSKNDIKKIFKDM